MNSSSAKEESEELDTLTREQKMITQNLRASHKILSVVSRSKEETELVLDELPELFFMIDSEGNILKANNSASLFLGVAEENWLTRNIYEFFTKERRKIFASKLFERPEMSEFHSDPIYFELPVVINDQILDFNWSINKITDLTIKGEPVFSIVASDISEIRKLERQLSQIFAAVPLGIFIIDADGFIVGPKSAFTDHIFGDLDCENNSIFDILASQITNEESSIMADGLNELKMCMNEDEMWFQFAEPRFPKEFKISRNGSEIFINIHYHAVTKDGIVVNSLMVVSDVTEMVKSRTSKERENSRLQRKVAHFLAVEQTPIGTVHSILEDFPVYHSKMQDSLADDNTERAKFALHSIKSLFRAAGIDDFTDLIRDWENKLAGQFDTKQDIHDLLVEISTFLTEEWLELKGILLLKAESAKTSTSQQGNLIEPHQIRLKSAIENTSLSADEKHKILALVSEIGYPSFHSFVQDMTEYCSSTADSLKVNAAIDFDYSMEFIPTHLITFLKESFMHLITNVIDHGFSSMEDSFKGKIQVKVTNPNPNQIAFVVEDNGCGFNLPKIFEIAQEKGLTKTKFEDHSDQDVLAYLLTPDFSTKKEANTFSGRGVGLSAVHDGIKYLGGDGLQLYNHTDGAGFKFFVNLNQEKGVI